MTPEAFIAFARSLPEPMALTDERGRVVASNAAARDFVVPLRTGISVCDLSPDGPRLREWLAACRDARGLLKTTVPLRRDDGTLVDVRIEAASLAERRDRRRAGRRCCCASARGPRGRRSRRCTSPKRATASCSRTPCTASAAATSTAPSSKATRRSRRCSATPRPSRSSASSWPTSTRSPTRS